jgi:hypothetical protein
MVATHFPLCADTVRGATTATRALRAKPAYPIDTDVCIV